MTVHAASYICMYMCRYFQEIEGGCNNEDLCFCLTAKPPLQSICVTVIDKALLRSRRGELLQSTCRGSIIIIIIMKDGVVGHVHVHDATFCKTQQVVLQPDSSHRLRITQQDDMPNYWPQETVRDH